MIRHRLLDVSMFSGQHFICECGHWSKRATWHDELNVDDEWTNHVDLWREAEAELDVVDATAGF